MAQQKKEKADLEKRERSIPFNSCESETEPEKRMTRSSSKLLPVGSITWITTYNWESNKTRNNKENCRKRRDGPGHWDSAWENSKRKVKFLKASETLKTQNEKTEWECHINTPKEQENSLQLWYKTTEQTTETKPKSFSSLNVEHPANLKHKEKAALLGEELQSFIVQCLESDFREKTNCWSSPIRRTTYHFQRGAWWKTAATSNF